MFVRRTFSIPLTRKDRGKSDSSAGDVTRPASEKSDGMLIVGHGSHCKISAAQMYKIGDHAANAFPELMVEVGFLEMTSPPANLVLDQMVAAGCKRIVVMPFMLLAATHSKSDVPAIVIEGRVRHPQIQILFGSALGLVPELIEIAAKNIHEVGANDLPLLVIARGTSDPDANGDAVKASRLLGEWLDCGMISTGFTGMTWPRTPQALQEMGNAVRARPELATSGETSAKFAVFFWFICNGKLVERARNEIADFTAATGIEVVDAGYFGPDELLVKVLARRYHEALEGAPTVNCDTCAYRAPFPGQESKVGLPIGEGHSHFAAKHRASHSHEHAHSHD